MKDALQMLLQLIEMHPLLIEIVGPVVVAAILGLSVRLCRSLCKQHKEHKVDVLNDKEEAKKSGEQISQSSMGDKSPNIVGDNNTVFSAPVVALAQSFPITEYCLDEFLMSHTREDWEDETCISSDEDTIRKYQWWSRKDRRVSYIFSCDKNNHDFDEPWLNFIQRPDCSVWKGQVEFFFEQTSVFRKCVVSLDGGRFVVPLPRRVVYHDGFLKGEFSGEKKRVGLSGDAFEIIYPLDHHPVKKVIWTKLDLKIASFMGTESVHEYLAIFKRYGLLEVI